MQDASASPTDDQNSVDADEYLWVSEENVESHSYLAPAIIKRLKERNCLRVLDLGCGNGSFSRILAAAGFEVVGLDPSSTGISYAQQKGGDFRCHSVDEPLASDLVQRFDAVIATEVIEHLLFPRNIFRRAKEALVNGSGTIIVTTPYHGYLKNLAIALLNGFDSHWHPLRDFGHIKFFSVATLSQLFAEMRIKLDSVEKVGRFRLLAKSMILTGTISR